MVNEPTAARRHHRVEIVGVADYNGERGVVAWVDGDRLGVWLDSQDKVGTDMPVTFLRSEVRVVTLD